MGNKELHKREKWLKNYWRVLCKLQGNVHLLKYERKRLLKHIKYPRSLFRYRSVNDSSLDALKNNVLYYSAANYYDDPFDSYLRAEYDKFLDNIENINRSKIKKQIYGKIFPVDWEVLEKENFRRIVADKALPNLRKIFQEKIFSICFCENVENEVLWLKYAENHKGFVLEYSIDENLLDEMWNGEVRANLLPVYYSENKYNALLYALFCLIHFSLDIYPELQPQFDILKEHTMLWETTKIAVIKKKCHEYDKEWRIVPFFIMENRQCIRMVPKSVTIGLRISDSDKNRIISAAQIAGISEFYQMIIDEHDNFVRVPLTV